MKRLVALENRLKTSTTFRSLAPDRKTPTLPSVLLGENRSTDVYDGFCDLIEAQLEHFPETIFWDFDFLYRACVSVPTRFDRIANIFSQYGRHSIIRFRYAHDFTYGFDWARWVARDVPARETHGPFSDASLAYIETRGEELVELIETDDEKYPKLPNGEPRNPYVFSRDPEDESVLFETLAARHLVPVRAWCSDEPRWNLSIAEARDNIARELGLIA